MGYLVDGALGTQDGESLRMVRTPWSEEEMPFERAAEIGTQKVIGEHSTIGLVVTTDGSVTELPRAAYVQAEARVVDELKALDKPFFVWYYHLAPMGKLWAFSEISYRSAQSVCRYRDNLNQFWR